MPVTKALAFGAASTATAARAPNAVVPTPARWDFFMGGTPSHCPRRGEQCETLVLRFVAWSGFRGIRPPTSGGCRQLVGRPARRAIEAHGGRWSPFERARSGLR